MTMGTVLISALKKDNPSMAEETDIGGVITLSASIIAPPIIAIQIKYPLFRFLFIKANNENIPPSPLLSACKVKMTYFIVVNNVIVQKTAEILP